MGANQGSQVPAGCHGKDGVSPATEAQREAKVLVTLRLFGLAKFICAKDKPAMSLMLCDNRLARETHLLVKYV